MVKKPDTKRIIKVSQDTHSELEKLGSKTDSYDDIVRRLLTSYYEKCEGRKK